MAGPDSLVGCVSAWLVDFHGLYPRVRQYSVIEIGHELISLPLIQVGQLSVTGERMCT